MHCNMLNIKMMINFFSFCLSFNEMSLFSPLKLIILIECKYDYLVSLISWCKLYSSNSKCKYFGMNVVDISHQSIAVVFEHWNCIFCFVCLFKVLHHIEDWPNYVVYTNICVFCANYKSIMGKLSHQLVIIFHGVEFAIDGFAHRNKSRKKRNSQKNIWNSVKCCCCAYVSVFLFVCIYTLREISR